MAAVISDMTRQEQYLADDDPDLLKAQQMTGSIRWLELYRSYLLRDVMDRTPREGQDEVLAKWAMAMGRSKGAWRNDLKWTYRIKMDDLLAVFEEAGIQQNEWTGQIGTSHLGAIARAINPITNEPLTSEEMAGWAFDCYNAAWSVEELRDQLRAFGYLPAKRGIEALPPTKAMTAAKLLSIMAEQMVKSGKDVLLEGFKGAGQYDLVHTLRRIADRMQTDRRAATFTIEEGGKA